MRKSKIISVFGQIEEVVARQMMSEGKGLKLLYPTKLMHDAEMLPENQRFNKLGQPVRIVVVVPGDLTREYDERIAELRA